MHTEIVDTAKTGVRQAHWESDGAGSRSTGVSTQEVLATVTARSDSRYRRCTESSKVALGAPRTSVVTTGTGPDKGLLGGNPVEGNKGNVITREFIKFTPESPRFL